MGGDIPMRMRRFLAFVLAVVMLMSNTVTASATSLSGSEGENLNIVQNEDGTYTISPTDVESEDDESTDEIIDNPSSDEEQEPGGEDTGEVVDNPNGGNNDDTNPGGDGGDSGDPNGEDEDGDEPLNPEEGEGEDTVSEEEQLPDENSVSENSVSENTLDVPEMLLNETTTEGDIELVFGNGITGYSGQSMYFDSLNGAVKKVDEVIGTNASLGIYDSVADVRFTINLPEVGEGHEVTNYSVVDEDLMVKNAHNNCTLNLNGNTLLVETSAKVNISINGRSSDASITSSKVVVSAGDLQIFEPSVDNASEPSDGRISFSNLDIQMPTASSKLILGDSQQEETLAGAERSIEFSGCTITDSIDIDIYDSVRFFGTDTLNVRNLLIDLDRVPMSDGSNDSYIETVWFHQNLNATKITSNILWGVEDEHSLTVTELVTNDSNGTTIFLSGPSTFNTINANGVLDIRVTRGQGEVDGSLSFGKEGTITKSDSIRIFYVGEDDEKGNFIEYIPEAGENLVSVAAGRTDIDTETFDYFEQTSGISIFPEIKNNQDGSYEIVRADSLFSVNINGVNEGFDSLEALKTRINKIGNPSNTYYIELLKAVSVTENWDFSDLKAKSIILDLNRNTLTVEVNAYIKVNELRGGTINVINGTDFALYANKNPGTYLGAYDNRLVVSGVNLNFDTSLESNSGTFTIGELENNTLNVGYSDITLTNCNVTGLENIDIVMNGYVAWNIQEGAEYVANQSDNYSGKFDGVIETVSANSITVNNGGYGGASGYDKAQFGFYVGAEQITLDGELDAFSLEVDDFVVKQGAEITVSSESEIGDFTIEKKENADLECVYINLEKLYLDEDENIYSQGNITFSGAYKGVTGYGELCLEKTTMSIKVNSGETWASAYEQYGGISRFENNNTVVAVKTNDVNSGFLNTSNYQINTRSDGDGMSVMRTTVDAVNGLYELKAYTSENTIVVTETNSGDIATFNTLGDVKEYIGEKSWELYGQSDNTSGGNFIISLNKNVTNVGKRDLDYEVCEADSVELRMNNYFITYSAKHTVSGNAVVVDPSICLDRINGNGSNAKINLPANGTVEILPRAINNNLFVKGRNYAHWDGVTLVANNGTSELIVGNWVDPEKCCIEFGNVTFANSFKNIELYGDISIHTNSDLKATGKITVDGGELVYMEPGENETEGWHYRSQAYIAGPGKLSAASMEIVDNSRVSVYKLSLSGTLIGYVNGELVVLPGGSAELTNVELSGISQEYEAFYIGFESEYTQGGETVITPIGTLKIAGKVTNNTNLASPIFVYKNKCWDGDGVWYEYDNDEVIVTAPNSAVKASLFRIEGEGRCTKKIGNEIKADTVSVRVHYNGHMDGDKWIESKEDLTYEYYSFQDAVANLAADFDSRVGEYDFSFITDDELSANVTLPAFVQTAILGTVEDGEDVWNDEENEIIDWIGNGQFFQQFLDLNGKTLTTSGSIRLERGLRINSNAVSNGVAIDGKIVSTFGECALGISEGQTLIAYEGEEIIEIDPAPVLENVVVTAKNGGVNLYASDDRGYWLDASFETRGFFIEAGDWCLAPDQGCYIKATDLNVSGEWTEDIYDENGGKVDEEYHPASRLAVGTITLSNGGAGIGGRLETTDISVASCSLEVYEGASLSVTNDITLNNANMFAWPDTYTEVINNINMSAKSRLEVYGHLQAENITMDASKVFVADSGNLYVFDTLQIPAKKAAYAADALGDYTVENRGQLSAANVSMPVGTFANYEIVEAQTFSVKDYVGEDDAHLLCNTFKNTGAAKFGYGSNVLIHESGTVNNIYIYQYDGDDGQAHLGKASKAEVTLTGSFTKENENQKLAAYVSDAYAYVDEDNVGFWGNEEPNPNNEEMWYTWDYIDLWDDENEIDDNMKVLERGTEMFKTTISAFPVENIRVRPWQYWSDDEEPVRVENINNAVYQEGNSLKVIGEYINIHAELPNGDWSHLKGFTNWKDASAYLNTLNSKTTTYIVEIKEDINLGQTLDLPANVKQIVFWSENPGEVTLTFQGDITLKTDTAFENIILDAYTLDKQKNPVDDYQPTIDTKGKFFALRSVEFEDGGIKALKGTSTSYVHFVDTDADIASKVSGIHELVLTNGVELNITGGLSVNNLIIDKFWDREDAPARCTVNILGESSVLEVKKNLEMRAETTLDVQGAKGAIKLADVYTDNRGNILRTESANKITISGRVSSTNGLAAWTKDTVIKKVDENDDTKLLGYADGEAGEGDVTSEVMPFALILSAGDNSAGTTMATAAKVSPIWFVVESASDKYVFADFTRKAGDNILSGANGFDNVVLSVLLPSEDEPVREYLNSFETLQAAFTEIDKIAMPEMSYHISLKVNDEAEGNYTFPSKVAEVQIESADENTPVSISYKDSITLKSNVVFVNLNLVPSAKGTISVGNYQAIFENVTIDESVKTSINGSGTNKGSWVTFAGGATSMHITGDLTNVGTLVVGGTELQVDGKISAGTLILPEDEILTCLGAIAIGDVYTESGIIQTAPVYTWDKKKTEITNVSSNLTISGDVLEMPPEGEGVEPQLTVTFVTMNDEETVETIDLTKVEKLELDVLLSADGKGITLAKAVNVDTNAIVFGNALEGTDKEGNTIKIGTIYKKSGSLVYKCSDPVVLLQYVDNSGSEVETLCESFADAVTEINNLKTKRDYTMGIYALAFNAGTLTMPNAKYVDTLTICPMDCVRAEIQYMNNITFTSNVVLENIDFVQIVKNGKYEDGSTKYEPVDEVKVAPNAYPSAVSVSVAGAYFVSIVNDLDKNLVNNIVTFNTPITLNGNKKAVLNIGKGGTLQTLDVGSNFEPWAEKTSLVQGKITGFAEMNVFSPISLYGYSSLNSKKEETYNATELNVTNLNVSNGAAVVVGQDVLSSGDKVTVTNLNLTDGKLETSGTGTFTNVVLGEGTDTLAVYGQTFNINGNLTSLTSDAELVTGLSKKSEAALYIKGNVVLGDAATDIICVKVTEDAEVGVRPYILGQTIAEDEKNSTLLLKAKTAPIDVFRPSTGEGESCVLEDNEYDPAAPDQGYILKKTGENIQVYYGSEIGVALCGPAAENGTIAEVINYYPTYNDAVVAIEALKDTTAEYTIVVIQPVGTEDSPVALSMPSKAAKVTVVGYAGNAEKEAIYYTNAPSLKTDMVFANVTLAPEKVSKKVVSPAKLGITTGNFDITLQDIEVTGANAGIAKITGKNTATIKLDSEALVIDGDISAAKELIVAKNAKVTGSVTTDVTTIETGKTVTVDSKFTAKELKLNGASVVDAQKAAVTITDIASVGDNNKIVYGQDANSNSLLTIKGNVENATSPVILDMQAANLKTLDTTTNPAKISLAKEAKLATVEKESLDKMNFALNGATFNSSDYCWANKGVYRVSEAFAPIQIKDEQDNVITYCLDFAQAVNYINTAADIAQDYVINLAYTGAYVDVNLTDDKAAGKSAITMPGKDKAESVKVLGLNNGGTKIAFSGNITTYGDVIFENIWLLNDNASNFTIANKKDSDKDSSLTLIDTAANGKAVIKSISGEKGITDITIRIEEDGIYPSEAYGAISNAELVDISNSANVITFTGMSTVDNFTIAESKVQTTGKATVGTLNLQTNAAWEAKAAATVTTIAEAKAGSYIGTFHSLDKNSVSTGLPQFTVTGNVAEPVQVKLFNSKVTDANGEWLEIREAAGAEGFAALNAKVKYATDYANQKLVVAKAESADKFIATEYGYWNGNVFTFTNPGSVQAYKDKNGYVSNGNINAMEVLLSELDGNGAEIEGTKTYVATYAEAIQVINNLNNKDASYKILLRKTEGNEGVIKTALSGTTSVYGTLALPAAKKAASITIVGETDDMVMKYTSGLKPNCDVTFNNITLTEGSLDKKGNYAALNYITPNLDAEVTLTFAGNVKTLDAEDVNLVFNKISGKKGEIAFAANYDIESKGAISIADISGGDNVTINIHTYFTNKAWKKAATQLSINGDVQLGEGSIINVIPHVYDAATKTYDVISDAQMAEMLISSSATPASWQKVITAPKMQTMNGKITLCGKEDVAPVKYNGGVYFTDEDMTVVLRGIEITDEKFNEIIANPEGINYEYEAHFLTWEEAVKEIDRINSKQQFYVIELHGDLGVEMPLKTLTMPSKAYGLLVRGISDVNDESPDIMMTGTTITAKCNMAFDNVGITAVKKTGNNYYSVPFTLNTGNFEVEIENMPDMCRCFVDNGEWIEERGQYDSEMKVTGSAKGSFTYTPCEVWYDADRSGFIPKTENDVTRIVGGPDNYVDVISQISKVGNVILNTGDIVAARWDEEGNLVGDPIYAAYHDTNYYIPNGISGVNSFMITPDVRVDCAKTDFAVKDLMMGNPDYDESGNWTRNENSDEVSGLSARNITVSGLLTMASSWMHAGTSAVGDGKVTLTNVIFRDNHNSIEGKQDKNGNSLIQIKGTVGTDNEDMRICDSAVTIGLFYNNSSQNYVRVSEGMNLLTAPKAASSWFRPNYGWYDEETDEGADNMGWEIIVEKAAYPNGELDISYDDVKEEWVYATEFATTYGLYKSGNNIKYGQICEVFEYEYEHTYTNGQSEEETVTLNIVDVRDMAEARLWIGTDAPAWDAGQSAYLDFMTFEEAVKAIDSLNQKNERYCIELLRTVEIGNTAGNGKYSALSLPSKASKVTICGNDNSLLFTGNVTLKCNTEFLDVKLSPVKLVKGEVIPAEVNLAAGNFELTWSPGSRVVYAYEDNGEWHYDEGYAEDQMVGYTFANVAGSSKGKLILTEDSELSANNVTGFGEIIFEGDEPEDGYSWIYTKNNVSVTKVTYKQYTEAKLRVCGNLTVTSVTLEDDVDAQFRVFTGKTLKVNGTTLKGENGVKYNESVDNGDTDETLKLYLYDQTGTYAAGTKLVTGKYLDASEWTVYTTDEVLYTHYNDDAGTGLYLGKVAAVG